MRTATVTLQSHSRSTTYGFNQELRKHKEIVVENWAKPLSSVCFIEHRERKP